MVYKSKLDRFPKVRSFIAEKFSPEFDDFLSEKADFQTLKKLDRRIDF